MLDFLRVLAATAITEEQHVLPGFLKMVPAFRRLRHNLSITKCIVVRQLSLRRTRAVRQRAITFLGCPVTRERRHLGRPAGWL